MPSISQRDLDAMKRQIEESAHREQILHEDLAIERDRVDATRAFIEQIVEVAGGWPIRIPEPRGGSNAAIMGGYADRTGMAPLYAMDPARRKPHRLTEAEVRDFRDQQALEVRVNLEQRLAAVVAVAQYANAQTGRGR